MKNLKKKLIHWMGGVTREELLAEKTAVRKTTEMQMITQVRSYLDLMHDMDPDTWRKCAYEYISRLEKEKHYQK